MLTFDGKPCCKLFEDELKHNHCCMTMTECAHDPRIAVKYSPKYREYYIPLKKSNSIQTLLFCPWCGKELPKDLRDEYDEILEKEYNINIDDVVMEKKIRIPKEFKTDEWWKKRGL